MLFPRPSDGTVHLRQRERIYFSYLITLKPTGAMAKLTVRKKGMQEFWALMCQSCSSWLEEPGRNGHLGKGWPMPLHLCGHSAATA